MDRQIDLKYEKFFSLINDKYKDRLCLVSHTKDRGGALVVRIINSDSTYYWDGDYGSYNRPVNKNEKLKPLEWPRSTEGFSLYVPSDYNVGFKYVASAVHVSNPCVYDFGKFENRNSEDIKTILTVLDKTDKKVVFRTHDSWTPIPIKTIRLCGDYMTTENTIKDDYSLLIELKNLFSDEYDVFLEEYLKIVMFLDLETNIDQVRSFILLYKEKMKRLGINYKYQ